MIQQLIITIIVAGCFGALVAVIAKYTSIPQPWIGGIIVIITLIAILIILQVWGVVSLASVPALG